MEQTKIEVDRHALNELETRAEDINTKLLGLMRLLQAGRVDSALSLVGILQEANCKQIHGLIAAGAVDSAMPAGGWSTVPDDDDGEPVDAEQLDLAAIRSEFGRQTPE